MYILKIAAATLAIGASFAGGASIYSYARGTAFPAYAFPKTLTLKDSEDLTHDVKLLTFAIPDWAKNGTGLGPGSEMMVSLKNAKTGKSVGSEYSAIYNPDKKNTLQLAVKKVGDVGTSGALHQLKVGDKITVRGPNPMGSVPNVDKLKNVNLIAGGSGITPLYSVARYVLEKKPESKVNLIYANKTPEDIIFHPEFTQMAKENPDRFTVIHVLSSTGKLSGEKNVYEGRINQDILDKHLLTDANAVTLLCGPKGMVEALTARGSQKNGKEARLLSKYSNKVVVFKA